ncbi:sodium/calcium exchanger protein [Hymenobacter coccineus]|uniref:Sodium:proton exchanger n=1 Tax=Hymenobacter coccineus TaxID=1908235 RepID=A0A1G1TL60_9BACT|nr:sodium:proton exchanger [Hymenobacter coccineus]OGX91624.1 sodium:proton exchanger [Hymenobacter coccineus]
MRKFSLYVALAVAATLPGFYLHLTGTHVAPMLEAAIFFVAILGAGFLLSWGAEAAEEHVSQGLVIGVLALVTVLPEYAMDLYYTYQAGLHPGSAYAGFAAANMTGANRLLIGAGWPLIVGLYWWHSGKKAVALNWDNAAEIAYLALASLYSFVIVWRGSISFIDCGVLVGIFAAYLWRLSKLPKADHGAAKEAEADDDDDEVGPAAALVTLPVLQQWLIMGVLTIVAVAVIVMAAEPFAEALLAAGRDLGVNQFLLVQWVAPFASEVPEVVLVVLFVLNNRPTAALGALVSDKINQWTLLVGMIPVVYAIGAGHLTGFPLDARQHEEFFLTASQSLFAVALLLRLRLSLASAVTLLVLFVIQFGLAFVFQHDEARTIQMLTSMGWLYLALAGSLFLWNRQGLRHYLRVGLLARPVPAELHKAESLEAE